MYKYLRMDEDKCKKDKLIAKKRNILNEDDREIEDGNFLAYGEFDRIGIERIERFPRYRDVSERARTWIGDRQTILLYEIDRERDSFTYENNNFYVKTESEPQQSNHLFLGITILQFKYSQKKECKDMKEFLRHTRKKILKLVNEKYEDLSCSVFGMLGSFGIAIFWLADQYVDVLKAVTQIRNMSFSNRGNNKSDSAFLSAYTIFAQNHPIYCDTEQQEERRKKIAAIKGEAILHITLKNGVNQAVINEVKNACGIPKEQVMHHTTGEYDITVRINSNESFLVFQKGELLYCDSSFFQKNILQTSLQLCECLSENALEAGCEDKPSEKERDKQEALPFLDDIQKNYKILRKQFQEFPSTAGMIDTLDLLYSDYIAKISTASNEMWESNFSYQFFKILECLEEFNKNKEHVSMPRESVLKIINELLGDFERQISHIR